MKETKKLFPYRMKCTIIVLFFLFIAGVSAGSWYTTAFSKSAVSDSVLVRSLLKSPGASLRNIYSEFLFDHVFYLSIVFLFGLTFLGIAVIPAAVVLKGLTVGISFSHLLIANGDSAYYQKWITYLPAVLCVAVFIFFSAYAYGISLKFCGFLRNKGPAVSLKSYGLLFFAALIILAAAGCIHCIFSLLWTILF